MKKLCRHNQFFGVEAAKQHIARREGGIIWHTQGSGKSLTMVWLAKWIRENVPNSRVLIVTDRTELDEQIESVFMGVNEDIIAPPAATILSQRSIILTRGSFARWCINLVVAAKLKTMRLPTPLSPNYSSP
ncbi:HsdR family type I site-specific deoxyribonuclease [Escherichia coli]|nr:HsdR family type I site-specific deoxyribonuclease [Escherichia coli]